MTMRVVLAVLAALAAGGAWSAGDEYPAKLKASGRDLVDAKGRTVVLRGVNKPLVDSPDGFWDAEGEALFTGIGRWDPAVVDAALAEIARWGANTVRFHACVEWWKDNPSAYRDEWRDVRYPVPYREMLAETIRRAGRNGLYVILDFYNVKAKGGQDPLPWAPHSPHPEVVKSEDEFIGIWKSVARELGRFPHVLFELYNEPNGDGRIEAEWFAFCRRAVREVRAMTDNLIVIQWDYGCWVNLDYPPPGNPAATMAWVEEHPIDDAGILYSTHLYRTSGGGGGGMVHRAGREQVKCFKEADIESALELTGIARVARTRPLIVGEIGAAMRLEGEEQARELEWFRNTLAALNRMGVGYMAWAWHPEKHLMHGMLRNGGFFLGPNEAGKVFMEAVRNGSTRESVGGATTTRS